jgi:hypothetical protein
MKCLNEISVRTAKFCRVQLSCQVLSVFMTDVCSKFSDSI